MIKNENVLSRNKGNFHRDKKRFKTNWVENQNKKRKKTEEE